ncbi:hypothetical protein BV20DRAFT_969347 [Pilatotrama ljubarskyi]|nr:hypothetical protein BV20DRAFT_969347 [Pilatotrama ljubarskyi]
MIFTTVFVTCVFALLGVFQQVSVDTLLSTLAHLHLHTPTLSSITTFLHVTGSVTRFALDAAPLPEVDSFFSRLLPSANLSKTFTHLDINIPDFPFSLDASLVPANVSDTFFSHASGLVNVSTPLDSFPGGPGQQRPLWYRALNTVIRIVSLALAYQIFRAVLPHINELLTDQSTPQSENGGSPAVTGSLSLEHILGLDGHPDGQMIAGLLRDPPPPSNDDDHEHDESRDRPYDPLAFLFSQAAYVRQFRVRTWAPDVPPSLATPTAPNPAEDPPRIFGVPCALVLKEAGGSGSVEDGNKDEDEDEDPDAYLRAALGIPEDGAPSGGGWYLDEAPSGSHPSQDTLDAWVFPREPGEDLQEGVVIVDAG